MRKGNESYCHAMTGLENFRELLFFVRTCESMFVWMCVSVCVRVWVHVWVCVCMCVCVCMHVCLYVFVCAHGRVDAVVSTNISLRIVVFRQICKRFRILPMRLFVTVCALVCVCVCVCIRYLRSHSSYLDEKQTCKKYISRRRWELALKCMIRLL